MSNYSLVLITTFQHNEHILNLINSIQNNAHKVKYLLVVVAQDSNFTHVSSNQFLDVVFLQEGRISLSKARNVALQYLLKNNIRAEYVMFPDDDTTFDAVFFNNFLDILNTNKCYITPIYNTGTKNLYQGKIAIDGVLINENQHSLIGSPNQVILYERFKNDISFNEELGVGAKYGSCEDYDLFLKLHKKGAQFYYSSNIYSFHPQKNTKKEMSFNDTLKRYKSYSPGFIYIVKEYRKYSFLPLYMIRPLGAGIISLFKLNFKMVLVYLSVFLYRIRLLTAEITKL